MNDELKALGDGNTNYQFEEVASDILERFENPAWLDPRLQSQEIGKGAAPLNRNGVGHSVHLECPEFTSLCPKTGQPDFATIVINYTPREWCVESKSLKLYMFSFRSVGEFHESCIVRIANDLVDLLEPYAIQVDGKFAARGGIPIWPTAIWQHPDLQNSGRGGSGLILPPNARGDKKLVEPH